MGDFASSWVGCRGFYIVMYSIFIIGVEFTVLFDGVFVSDVLSAVSFGEDSF